VKLPNPLEVYFPGGFRMEGYALSGVKYSAPAKGARVLSGFDTTTGNTGPILFEEGNLPNGPVQGALTLLSDNKTQVISSLEKLKLAINAKTGAVTGSFVFPITRKSVPIRGVILQGKIGKGVGFFPGSTINNNALQTGRIEFLPAVP
jgi:hypothetical protein